MAHVSPADITTAKREARDTHIGDDGESTADHIFVHVPEICGVDGWSRDADAERSGEYEHAWTRDGTEERVTMERTRLGWRVTFRGVSTLQRDDFEFHARKHAEARLVEYMLER